MSWSRRRTVRALAAVGGAVAVLLAAGCGSGSSKAGGSAGSSGGKKLKVVATTTQVADFARNVGGSHVDVTQILKPNVDPHDYEPSPADIASFGKADVVVENGVGLEHWLQDTLDSSGFHGPTVDCSRGVKLRKGTGEEAGEKDPHIWHDPANAKIMAGNIATALEKADPQDKAAYASNLKSYQGKLTALDTYIGKQIGSLPKDDRKLVTNHDAFGYYVGRYHLTFVGSVIPSLDTSAELSGTQLSNLVKKIKAQHVKAIFSESSLPPKTADTIGREAHVKVEAGEDSLYGDTLGPKGSDGDTYLRMERHNTDTIVGALGGS